MSLDRVHGRLKRLIGERYFLNGVKRGWKQEILKNGLRLEAQSDF